MRRSQIAYLVLASALMAVSGCGMQYPHYTTTGSPESRKVVIHLSETETKEVHAGHGIGGGITPELKAQLLAGQEAKIEKDGAVVTITQKGPVYLVSKVSYEGKDVKYHEPLW